MVRVVEDGDETAWNIMEREPLVRAKPPRETPRKEYVVSFFPPMRSDSSSDLDSGGSSFRKSTVITEISILIECVIHPAPPISFSQSQTTVMNEGSSGQFLAIGSVRACFEC
jgi:hypothetical protein